jgi:YrbI family 3-deoxy-D-manno-octulosonate 8-phosphate phosphatase
MLRPEFRSLGDRCRNIHVLVLDVDGVLTAGDIIYGDNGCELKRFHVRDGTGLKYWHEAKKQTALVTGRSSRAVEVRAQELGIGTVLQGLADKLQAFGQVLKLTQAAPTAVGVIGDDLADLPMLRNCGLAIAVADACPELHAEAHYVTHARGGRGAVREAIEIILKCQGQWRCRAEHP